MFFILGVVVGLPDSQSVGTRFDSWQVLYLVGAHQAYYSFVFGVGISSGWSNGCAPQVQPNYGTPLCSITSNVALTNSLMLSKLSVQIIR